MDWVILATTGIGFDVIGPFQSERKASDWGGVALTDPRWNVIQYNIDGEEYPIEYTSPENYVE